MGRLIGLIILLIGLVIFIGNISGRWPSFPLAGFITMGIGSLIIKFSSDD
jgi:hypothetical protein